MKKSTYQGKVRFTDCLRTLLYESFGEAESETYAYYQKHCSVIFKVEADFVEFNPHYFKVRLAIGKFEYLYHTHKDIDVFDIMPRKSGDKITLLSRSKFFKYSKDFYENEGRRCSSQKLPMSLLYVSDNFLGHLYDTFRSELFRRDFVVNDFTHQLERVYQHMKKQAYLFSEETTVKEFFRDMIEPLYPELSLNDQNVFWRFFKPQG